MSKLAKILAPQTVLPHCDQTNMNKKALHSCSHCAMSDICLPLGVDRNELDQLEALVYASRPLQNGEVIYRQGDRFRKIFAVKSGVVKLSHVDENGVEHIIGFHLPGELIGLDGIYPEHYTNTAATLETTVMCEMDYDRLTELCSIIPSLQKQMFRLLGRDIHESNVNQSGYVDQSAEQKLARFLNNLSARYSARGFSAERFPLQIPRQDIANFLGMAPETISRLIKRFKDKDILDIDKNTILMKAPEQLADIISCQHG